MVKPSSSSGGSAGGAAIGEVSIIAGLR
jgi:hypothetical protein